MIESTTTAPSYTVRSLDTEDTSWGPFTRAEAFTFASRAGNRYVEDSEGRVIERATFTEMTWAKLGAPLSKRNRLSAWTELHDLAVEAYESTRESCALTFEDWRSLVSAANAGLPIILTHEHRLNGTDQVERTTRTYVVESLEPRLGVYGAVRAHTWGFTINLALSDLLGVTVPEPSYEYRTEA
jgi:hypothetical protein